MDKEQTIEFIFVKLQIRLPRQLSNNPASYKRLRVWRDNVTCLDDILCYIMIFLL